MESCSRAKAVPPSNEPASLFCLEPIHLLLDAVERLIAGRSQSLLSRCLGTDSCESIAQLTTTNIAKFAEAITTGSIASGSTLDDFLQLIPNGDRRCLTLLVLIDRIVDKLKHPRDRVQRLETAARRRHLLLPRDTLGDAEAAWKQAALRSVVHAEVSLLDDHVAACRDCTLLHRWRSWALSFVLLLPHQRAVAAVDPSALVSHALVAMLGDDSLDYAKDVAEGTGTLFTHLLGGGAGVSGGSATSGVDDGAKEADADAAAAGGAGGSLPRAAAAAAADASDAAAGAVSPRARGVVAFLGGLLAYVAAVVATIKPGVPELAPGETSPGVEAAAALPAQLAAALGKPDVADGRVNAVALRALLRLAIVLLHRAHDAGGRAASELAWRTWFSDANDGSGAGAGAAAAADSTAPPAGSGSTSATLTALESAQLDAVLSLSESALAEADAVAMRACMAAPSISTDMAVLRAVLTVPDEELGDNPSAMTLLWTAALLPPEDGENERENEGGEAAAQPEAAATVVADAPSSAP